MKQIKKTFNISHSDRVRQIFHNNNSSDGKNKIMIKKRIKLTTINNTLSVINADKTDKCKIHVMPPPISDEDISALFSGIVNVMRTKIQLETRSEIINMNVNMNKLMSELKAKQSECIRLKNEIIYLKSQLKN